MDARPILPLIQASTLVLHRRDYQFGRDLVHADPPGGEENQ
jgi:hypothetical protein